MLFVECCPIYSGLYVLWVCWLSVTWVWLLADGTQLMRLYDRSLNLRSLNVSAVDDDALAPCVEDVKSFTYSLVVKHQAISNGSAD